MTGKEQNDAPIINAQLDSIQCFHVVSCSSHQFVGGDQLALPAILYLDFLDDGTSPVPDITESKMFLFLAIIIQIGYTICDNLKEYWSIAEQFVSPFYGKTRRRDRFLTYLDFSIF
jgi:hypothetical protein